MWYASIPYRFQHAGVLKGMSKLVKGAGTSMKNVVCHDSMSGAQHSVCCHQRIKRFDVGGATHTIDVKLLLFCLHMNEGSGYPLL